MKWAHASIVPETPTYYIDSVAGDDGNNGSEGAPFATIGHATSLAGAFTKIALKKGSTFRETLTASAARQAFAAYGSGNAPIVTGCDVLGTSGWSIYTPPSETFVSDTFNRSDTADDSGWGTADGGTDSSKTWTGTTGLKIASNRGLCHGGFAFLWLRVGDAHTEDMDVSGTFFGIPASSDRQYGFILRSDTDLAPRYECFYRSDTDSVVIRKVGTDGNGTDQTTGITALGTDIKVRVQCQNVGADVVVRVKAWNAADSEPGSWSATWTDDGTVRGAPLTTGQVGVNIGNDGSSQAALEDFVAASLAEPFAATYTKALTTDPGEIVLENGARLARVASIAAVEGTEGSFYWASDVLYVHPTGGASPASNGKTYETPIRPNAANLGAHWNVVLDGLDLHGALAVAAVGTGGRQTVRNCTVRLSNDGGLDLTGVGCCGEFNTYSGIFDTFERISATGYVSRGNTKTIPDVPQIRGLRVESGVTDTPLVDGNTYARTTNARYGLHQVLGYFGAYEPFWRIRFEAAEAIGARVTRDVVAATLFNTGGSGVYDWTRFDDLYAYYEARPNLRVIFNWYNSSPSWMNGETDEQFVPGGGDEAATAFLDWVDDQEAAFIAWLTRYQDIVTHVEIGNEINEQWYWSTVAGTPTATADADQQRVWLERLCDAAKTINASIKVGIAGLTGLGASGGTYNSGNLFLQHLLDDAGGLTSANYDAVAIHPYDEGAPEVDTAFQGNFTDIGLIRSTLTARGLGAKEIWVTEWSWFWDDFTQTQREQYTATALDMLRSDYPYVTNVTFFQDLDTVAFPDAGLFDIDGDAKAIAEIYAQRTTPLMHWKGTDYSFPQWQAVAGLDANSTVG